MEPLISFLSNHADFVLSTVGTMLTGVFSLLCIMLKYMWTRHKKQMRALAGAIEALGEAVLVNKEAASGEHAKIRETMTAFRAEVHLVKQSLEPIKAGMLSLEGAVKLQNATINSYVEKMGIVSGQLAAVFRFIDAPSRRTDNT